MKPDDTAPNMGGALNDGGESQRGLHGDSSEKVLPDLEDLESPFARLFLAVKDETEKVQEVRSHIDELSALTREYDSVMESIKNLTAKKQEVLDLLEAKSEECRRLEFLINNLDINNVKNPDQKQAFLNEMPAFVQGFEEKISKFHGITKKLTTFFNRLAVITREIAEKESSEFLKGFNKGTAKIDATIKECSDALKIMYEAEQNPTFVWLAIFLEGSCGSKSIPSWCTEYLFQSAENLSGLLIDRASIKSNYIASAFHLIEPGKIH